MPLASANAMILRIGVMPPQIVASTRSALQQSSRAAWASICKSIARAITDHEPRLRNVAVDLDKRNVATQKLRFSIHAVLLAHPLQEPVNFDAVLQTTTQNYAVQAGGRAG